MGRSARPTYSFSALHTAAATVGSTLIHHDHSISGMCRVAHIAIDSNATALGADRNQ
jgi:hypothetical protein